MHSKLRRYIRPAAIAALVGSTVLAFPAFAQTAPATGPADAQSAAAPPPPVSATVTTGAYVFGDIGANWLRDAHSRGVNTTYSYDTGWVGLVGGGWGFGNGIRVEGELGHRGSDVSNTSGSTSANSLMGNVYYDFATGTPITPYVGVGTGVAHVRFHNVGAPGTSIDDGDTVWAYQGIAGLTYQLSNHWKADANYRYFGTERPDLTAANGTPVTTHYRDHALLLGIRYEFGP